MTSDGKVTMGDKPTIHELEAVLDSPAHPVSILPNGEVVADDVEGMKLAWANCRVVSKENPKAVAEAIPELVYFVQKCSEIWGNSPLGDDAHTLLSRLGIEERKG